MAKIFRPQAYSLAQVNQAKQLFMSFETTAAIARQTGIPRSTLRYYIRESWKEEREGDARDLVNRILGGRAAQLEELSILTVDTIMHSISEIRASKKVLRTADLLNLARTLEIMDKIALLDKKNNPDTNSDYGAENDTIEMEEIKTLDPFFIEAPKKEEENDK